MAAINGTYRAILGNEVVKAGAVEKSFDNPEDYLNYWIKILNDPSYVDNEELLGEETGGLENLGAGSGFSHIKFHYQDKGSAVKEYDLYIYVTVEMKS